ncbi:MAG: hypothetical protein KF764_08770 [Labilithrix sp.]|nr:hypothetical protein [Labilithrix sp.]
MKLTPQAKKERGMALVAEGNRLIIEATLEERVSPDDWYTQHSSPLKKRRYLELARTGKIPSRKDGTSVLVRRADLDAYIEREGLARGGRALESESVEDVVAGILRVGGGRR